jgi:hypothetical protein
MSWFMGRIVERICQIGQHVESKVRLLVLEQHVGIDELKHHEKWTVCHESISEFEERTRR